MTALQLATLFDGLHLKIKKTYPWCYFFFDYRLPFYHARTKLYFYCSLRHNYILNGRIINTCRIYTSQDRDCHQLGNRNLFNA